MEVIGGGTGYKTIHMMCPQNIGSHHPLLGENVINLKTNQILSIIEKSNINQPYTLLPSTTQLLHQHNDTPATNTSTSLSSPQHCDNSSCYY